MRSSGSVREFLRRQLIIMVLTKVPTMFEEARTLVGTFSGSD